MTLAFRSDETSPLVAALLDDLGMDVDLAIDAHDEMLGFLVDAFEGDRERALFAYFRSGASIADSLGQVLRWRFGGMDRIGKILDFASGYGRVTRFLVREVPPERVWVSDVYADGVRFQEERFGVHGIVSAIRPEDFVLCRAVRRHPGHLALHPSPRGAFRGLAAGAPGPARAPAACSPSAPTPPRCSRRASPCRRAGSASRRPARAARSPRATTARPG